MLIIWGKCVCSEDKHMFLFDILKKCVSKFSWQSWFTHAILIHTPHTFTVRAFSIWNNIGLFVWCHETSLITDSLQEVCLLRFLCSIYRVVQGMPTTSEEKLRKLNCKKNGVQYKEISFIVRLCKSLWQWGINNKFVCHICHMLDKSFA